MYKIGDYIIYRHDVCKVKNIKDDYYVLNKIDDESLIINTPVDNRMSFLRNLITEKQALDIIASIPNIELLNNIDDKNMELRYKELLQSGLHADLVRIIKTAYKRNEKRINNKKKISEKDDNYFKLAEKYLYNELAIALNKTVEEIQEMIANECSK